MASFENWSTLDIVNQELYNLIHKSTFYFSDLDPYQYVGFKVKNRFWTNFILVGELGSANVRCLYVQIK